LIHRTLLSTAVAGAAILLAASTAAARDYDAGAIHISHPWIRATPPGAATAAGYLTITNRGSEPDRLLGGETPDANSLGVHEMSMNGPIMRMRPIPGGLLIAPGKSVTLSAGGNRHLMLVGLKRGLKAGDQVPTTLKFQKAGSVKVTFTVEQTGGRVPPPKHPMAN
jgi:copper(I)-binding protein